MAADTQDELDVQQEAAILLRDALAADHVVSYQLELEASAVAELLGKSLRTLDHWRQIGYGPPCRTTRRRICLYPIADLVRWMRQAVGAKPRASARRDR